MQAWPDRRILELFGIELPIIQAPMAGAAGAAMAIAVSEAGGLGSLAAAMLTPAQTRDAIAAIRRGTNRPINVNFFCHKAPVADAARLDAWRGALAPYFAECGLDATAALPAAARAPFDDAFCTVVEACRPDIVSFHFGLPAPDLVSRVKATGARIIASATTVAEAQFLERHGCDAVIAMGLEAGGHRGNFLSDDMATQIGTFALVPQIADAVRVPVIAAGGIGDERGVVAALALGAAAVQIGTAYLLSPEATIPDVHRDALRRVASDGTAVTNVFTGRPARGIVNRLMREIGPISLLAPAFPQAGGAIAPLRAATEPGGSSDFISLWAGQGAAFARAMPAGAITRALAEAALQRMANAA